MNKKTLKTIPCTLGTIASGGLTKIGSGTLKLFATNTYTGATTVRKGTIQLMANDVIAPESELVLDGGTLDLNGMAHKFSNVRATENGGSVVNGTLTLGGLALDLDDALAGNVHTVNAAVAFAPGARLTVANVAKAVRPPNRYLLATFTGGINAANLTVDAETLAALPPRWTVSVESNRVMLRYPVGVMLKFR